MRLPRRLPSLLLATSLAGPLLAACVDDDVAPPPPPAVPSFSTTSDAIRARTISAAAGHDALLAQQIVDAFPRYPEGACPVVGQTADGFLYQGGCELAGGGRIDGRVEVAIDLAGERDYTFEGFSIERDGERLGFDGRIVNSGFGQDIRLSAVIDGIYAETLIDFDCRRARCAASPGATVEVEGLGLVGVFGDWTPGRTDLGGYLVLTAGQPDLDSLLSITLDGAGCGDYTINNVPSGSYCIPDAPALDLRNDLAAEYTCVDGGVTITASSLYPYAAVAHRRIIGHVVSGTEVRELFDQPLALEPVADANGRHVWSGELEVSCDEFRAGDHVVVAEVGEQEVARRSLTEAPAPGQ